MGATKKHLYPIETYHTFKPMKHRRRRLRRIKKKLALKEKAK
jgi:hypothetical protein